MLTLLIAARLAKVLDDATIALPFLSTLFGLVLAHVASSMSSVVDSLASRTSTLTHRQCRVQVLSVARYGELV